MAHPDQAVEMQGMRQDDVSSAGFFVVIPALRGAGD
jgi:hypothetical protein